MNWAENQVFYCLTVRDILASLPSSTFIFTNTVITDYKSSDPHLNSTHYAGIVCFVKQAQYVEVLVNNTMFSFKQLEYYIASEVIYHIRCYNGNKQRYSLTDRRERQGEG